MTVDLWECSCCGLLWVADEMPAKCPACRLRYSVPRGPIMAAGRDIRVSIVRDYGRRVGMLNDNVRRIVAKLQLLDACPCGWNTVALCPKCSQLPGYLTEPECCTIV